jgi:hypothetical protein
MREYLRRAKSFLSFAVFVPDGVVGSNAEKRWRCEDHWGA